MKNKQLLMDLTDEQCEKVVGGVGRNGGGQGGGAGAGTQGWFGNGSGPPDPSDNGLFGSGQFSGPVLGDAGPNEDHVWRPGK